MKAAQFALSLIALFASINADDVYHTCKGDNCFALPDQSCIDNRSCKLIVSFQEVELNNGTGVHFMVEGHYHGVETGYIALGLSNDTMMGDDSVVVCYADHTGSHGTVAMYWNTADPNFSWPLEDAQNGLSDIKLHDEKGKIFCSFTREIVTNLVLPNDLGEVEFDLAEDEFFLLLATGPRDEDGNIGIHSDAGFSEDPFQLVADFEEY